MASLEKLPAASRATYGAMSKALATVVVPDLVRAMAARGQLTPAVERQLWDGVLRRARPMKEVAWMVGEEAQSLGVTTTVDMAPPSGPLPQDDHRATPPLAFAARLRKVQAFKTLLDAGVHALPREGECTAFEAMIRHIPEKALPPEKLLNLMREAGMPLDCGPKPAIHAVLERNHSGRFRLDEWLVALEAFNVPLKARYQVTGDTTAHALVRMCNFAQKDKNVEAWMERLGLTTADLTQLNAQGQTAVALSTRAEVTATLRARVSEAISLTPSSDRGRPPRPQRRT